MAGVIESNKGVVLKKGKNLKYVYVTETKQEKMENFLFSCADMIGKPFGTAFRVVNKSKLEVIDPIQVEEYRSEYEKLGIKIRSCGFWRLPKFCLFYKFFVCLISWKALDVILHRFWNRFSNFLLVADDGGGFHQYLVILSVVWALLLSFCSSELYSFLFMNIFWKSDHSWSDLNRAVSILILILNRTYMKSSFIPTKLYPCIN